MIEGRTARWLAPLAAVAVIAAALVAIALHSFEANRSGALELSEQVLVGVEGRITARVDAFLSSPERALRLARQVYSLPPGGDQQRTLERFGQAILQELPQVSLVMAADERGNYIGISRREGGSAALLLQNEPGPRSLTRTLFDARSLRLGTEPVAENNFDPRTRPWYRAGRAAEDTSWTDLYVFFIERVPGLTVASAVRTPDGETIDGVIALDVSLSALSDFLGDLGVAAGGRVVILDSQGRVVAHPDHRTAGREEGGALVPLRLDELGDPLLARAYDRLRVDRAFRTVEEIDGERHLFVGTPLTTQGATGWSLLITVPEASFAGFVTDVNQRVLLMYAGVLLLALLLALVLVRQGLRADATARRLRAAEAGAAAEREAFDGLAGSAALYDAAAPLPPEVTEQLAALAGAPRSAIWRLANGGRALVLEDGWDAERRGHTSGAELRREEAPAFFAALATRDLIDAPDAARERVTAELHRLWLSPLGSTRLLAAPIRHDGRALGVVWLEDPTGSARVSAILASVAKLLALSMAGGAVKLAARRPPAEAPPPVAPGGPEVLKAAALAGAIPADIAADALPGVAVAVLRLTDPVALAARGAGAQTPLMTAVARALEQSAAEAGLPYLRLLGEQAVAAAGLTPETAGAPGVRSVAAFALAARDRLAALFEEAGHPPAFRIGIDLGLALGSRLGAGEGFLNLWGEAPEAADRMAASAPEASVQATERAYAALSQSHLFRPRGAFHLPRLGAMNSYVLAAALTDGG